MKNTEHRLPHAEAFAREHHMFPPGSKVLCAVSGGADSMCLLHWLSRREDITVVAAHFDHQLRGEESGRDERFVRSWCEQHAIPFHLGTWDVRAEAGRRKMGIEETARALRYGFLSQLAVQLQADRIATAHNAGDNAETVLMHLLRGSALPGLTGIEPVRWKYVRPFLTTSREEIETYLAQHRVPHVEDSSNADDSYTRNRVRHQLVPLLEEMNPGFVRRLCAAIPRLRADEEYLGALAQDLFRLAQRQGEDLTIPAAAIAQAPPPVAARTVRLLLAEAAEGDWDCSAAHIGAVLSLCRGDSPSARVSLPHQLTALREYGDLVFTHSPHPEPVEEFVPREGDTPLPGTDWLVRLAVPPWPGLVIRSRQTGDEITLSNGHRRSLKKLFIDRKIPKALRDSFPVAADGDGVIFAAPFGPNLSHPRSREIQITDIRETTP